MLFHLWLPPDREILAVFPFAVCWLSSPNIRLLTQYSNVLWALTIRSREALVCMYLWKYKCIKTKIILTGPSEAVPPLSVTMTTNSQGCNYRNSCTPRYLAESISFWISYPFSSLRLCEDTQKRQKRSLILKALVPQHLLWSTKHPADTAIIFKCSFYLWILLLETCTLNIYIKLDSFHTHRIKSKNIFTNH